MDVEMYERALARTRGYVEGTTKDRLTQPSPCTDWTVRDVLNHLINGARSVAAGAHGETIPFDDTTDRAGDDHVTEFKRASEDALEGFRQPGVLEKTFPMSWGDSPGSVVLALAIADAAVHGWDLAAGTGQEARIDEDIAEAVLQMTSSMMEPKGQMPRGDSFGPPIDVPDDAPPQDRLLAYLGRSPNWSPST
jgi:uncharacterized protein (TIGR03086 family)